MIVGDKDFLVHLPLPVPRAHRRGEWLLLVLAVILMSFAIPAVADERRPLVLTGPADIEMVGRHFDYVLDPDWTLSAKDFLPSAAVEMAPLQGSVPDFGYTPARVWLRLELLNQTRDASAWRFYIHANFTQQVAVYRLDPDGTLSTLLALTTDSPFSARPLAYPEMVAPFELAPGQSATLLVQYYSQGSSRMSMSVETAESFAARARLQEAKNYAFYGMVGVLAAMAGVALLLLRKVVFAAYVAYLLSMLLYIAHADGVAFQYLWPNLPQFNSMASVVAGSSVMVCGGLFAMSFLQTRRYHPVMHRIVLAVIGSVVVLDAILWATAPQLLKQLLVIMISVCALVFIAAGIVAARTRFREVRFYLFAWLASLIPAVLFTARFALGLEINLITTYDAVRIALIFDALMMGLAVFDGYNQQRQAALEQTLAQAQRNLALGERLALLEESYEQLKSTARRREESVKDTVHDLRQPMHALRLSLRQMFGAPAGARPDIDQVETALGYMEKLVADRLADDPDRPLPAAGPAAPEPEADGLRLHDVLRGVVDMFAAEAEARGLGLRLVIAAPDAQVAAYPLMRALANLVSNAIKYTPEGRILVSLRREGTGHRIEVHDTGPGLGGAAFRQALQRNQRLERDRQRADGSGLGLAVVSEIATGNGWHLDACDRRRTGASIRLHLPAR